MDARERLRRYLEQRRELGESELVLDSLPVDDVMRMLGARATARTRAGAAGRPTQVATTTPKVVPADPPGLPTPFTPPVPQPRIADVPATSDWRAALTASGAESGEQAARARPDVPAPAGLRGPADSHRLPEWIAALGVTIGVRVGSDSLRAHAATLAPEVAAQPTLADLANVVASCQRCALYRTARNPVPGEGNPDADFVCVGEAPGQTEDEQGRPFVGAAGQLLTKILGAINLAREDVFICNVIKHRPPGNRDPLPDEVLACAPYLLRQLDLVRPRVILALGSFAARTLLSTDSTIARLRGKIHFFHGVPLIVTYHPAALLRNESWKRPAWDDVQLARRVYDAARSAASARPSSDQP